MANPKLLVVVGATGMQGSSVIEWTLKHKKDTYRIRGTTRNASSDAASALRSRGVEVVQADANDSSSLRAAFAGASVIFAYTDSTGCMKQVMESSAGIDESETALKRAADLELQQGRNIAEAAAGIQELDRLVWSNLPDVNRNSRGKFSGVLNFDCKDKIWTFSKSLPELQGRSSSVVVGVFADNAKRLGQVYNITKESPGEYVYHYPLDGNIKLPFIDIKHDLGAFVHALVQAPAGLQVLGVTEQLTSAEWIALWARENGVKGSFEKTPLDKIAVAVSLSSGMKGAFGLFGFMEEFGYSGGDPETLSPEEFYERTGVMIPRTTIAEHIRREDWSKILQDQQSS